MEMKYLTLAEHAVREYAPDKIYMANQIAKRAAALYGEDKVINSTLGECMDDNGKLMILPTVENLLRNMSIEDMCSYAPIAGLAEFNKAVQVSLFGKEVSDHFVESVATPGSCGALRHAVWNFLDDGEAVITTNWNWGPYKGICEEHNRRLETFEMFNEYDSFNLKGLDDKIDELAHEQNHILIILNTPAHNPTGYSMTKIEMDNVVEIIKKHARNSTKKITLCLDVSYIDFDGTFEESREIFDSISEMPENVMVIVAFSMSKSYTICGMRCGALVCLAHTEEAMRMFKQAMAFSSRSVWSNTVRSAQKLLIDICLNSEKKTSADMERNLFKEIIAARSRAFLEEAEQCGLKCCPYKSGFFIAVPCKNSDLIAEKLKEKHVYIVAMPYGIRFSLCAVTKDKCRRTPKIIKEVLNNNAL
ncbi:aminotransferase class I/II-fold pyridoxal phosphate-dependent enzyme [Petroclostridium sp. X23]|uniref:pyridoxal phosphate-dependent aminotransferase n=1 Tax=Petroclostridium sp. X23 TaxID=3045146 RepID=UPI0024ADA948|nr:aminotransferase class I/II-fold pyridoxal phosphate-dependent enzyme [Petroclostridium sp. X23]WHH60120.1 aminotransferase class I/II-fold pyridoxal phosphate-dependent enzyme [Petroclostridium sp. X23]